jgi:dihydroorotase
MRPLILVFAIAAVATAQHYDLLSKGGHVIDAKNGVDAVRDVAIQEGKIAAVAADIPSADAKKVIDASGLYVTPGLVDMHVHLFHTTNIPDVWAGDNSVDPDSFSFRSCTTTMVDAGSAGWRNFEQFRATVIDRVQTRVFAMVNIVGYGMMSDVIEQNTADMVPETTAAMAKRNRDVVVGIKTAHYMKPDWTAVDRALEAGRLAGVPIMVDFGYFVPERPYWQLVTQKLRPGDISTHMYRSAVPYVDAKGKLYGYLTEARARGVKFDVGHGAGSFVFRNAVPAIKHGFYPDTISTDLHSGSKNGAMMDMVTTMSKLMAIGLPLKEAIVQSTWNPAQVIGHRELGHLTPGAFADVAVFSLVKGQFGYVDPNGGRMPGTERLQCEMTLKDGKVSWDWNGRAGRDWRELPPDYGIRAGEGIYPPPTRR